MDNIIIFNHYQKCTNTPSAPCLQLHPSLRLLTSPIINMLRIMPMPKTTLTLLTTQRITPTLPTMTTKQPTPTKVITPMPTSTAMPRTTAMRTVTTMPTQLITLTPITRTTLMLPTLSTARITPTPPTVITLTLPTPPTTTTPPMPMPTLERLSRARLTRAKFSSRACCPSAPQLLRKRSDALQ